MVNELQFILDNTMCVYMHFSAFYGPRLIALAEDF